MEIFGPRLARLARLAVHNDLQQVICLLGHIINEDNFIGHGDDASCFKYTDTLVLKLCTKQIKYFKYTKNATVSTFHQLSSRLDESKSSILLPIDKILYEDDNVFVYTQLKCDRLYRQDMTEHILNEIIQIEYTLLKCHLHTSTGMHNLGLYQGHVVVFDYHDLKPLKITESWCQSVIRHLIKHISTYYGAKHTCICELLRDCKVPRSYRELLYALQYGPLHYESFIKAYETFLNKI